VTLVDIRILPVSGRALSTATTTCEPAVPDQIGAREHVPDSRAVRRWAKKSKKEAAAPAETILPSPAVTSKNSYY